MPQNCLSRPFNEQGVQETNNLCKWESLDVHKIHWQNPKEKQLQPRGHRKKTTTKIVRKRRRLKRSKCHSYLSVDCAVFKIVPAHYHLSLGWKKVCSWLPWWCQQHSSGSPFSLKALQCLLSQNGQSFWLYLSFVFVTDLMVHKEAAQRNSPLAILYMKDEHSFFQPVHREVSSQDVLICKLVVEGFGRQVGGSGAEIHPGLA